MGRRTLLHIARSSLLLFIIGSIGIISASAQKRGASKRAQKPAVAKNVLNVEEILEAEELLSGLGYWTGPVDGKFDEGSRHALVAFQKVEGRLIKGKLTREELEALRLAQRPEARETSYAHVEVDLTRQVLFMVDGRGRVTKVLPVSTGNGKEFTSEGWTRRAITPMGRFKIHRKVEGWRKAPLGLLYYPNYFLSGVGIHGNPSVPTYPDSHGCVRIPMFAAKEFSEMVSIGTWVIVHDGSPVREEEFLPVSRR